MAHELERTYGSMDRMELLDELARARARILELEQERDMMVATVEKVLNELAGPL